MRAPVSPSKRVYHSMLYDTKAGHAIVFGGQAYYHWGMDLQDVWALDVSSMRWESLGALEAGEVYAAAYDQEFERAIMLNLRGETWAYSFSLRQWEKRNPPEAPAARYGHRMTYDAHARQVVLFGGFKGTSLDEPLFDDTWTYDYRTDRWTLMEPELQPPARIYHSMVYHPAARRTLVWGGRPFVARDDVTMWAYDSLANTWDPLRPSTGPNHRFTYAPMVYCPQSDRVLMFGGLELTGSFDGRLIDETWLYDLGGNRWSQPEVTNGPAARSQHAMVFSPTLRKAIVFGGEVGGAYAGEFAGDLWLYDPVANKWEEAHP